MTHLYGDMLPISNTVSSIKDINENCLAEFRTHWQCLENHNQQLWNCRSEERKLNKCVFNKLV
jgi:NADH dehydrogenase (ubiquinone) 1 alpha subcomplex subunit 8